MDSQEPIQDSAQDQVQDQEQNPIQTTEQEQQQIQEKPDVIKSFNKIFDLDWFDIQTKTKQMVSDLLNPTITKVHELTNLIKVVSTIQNQVKDLEYVVFRKNQKLSIFEQIDEKIALNEANRAEHEQQIWSKIDDVMKQINEIEFQN